MRALELALVVVTAAACSSPEPPGSPEPPESARLAAELVSPTDIELSWRAEEPAPAGRVVEFATEPSGRYTILGFLPPDQTRYRHADLMPETPFYYRLRPYYGPASRPVDVALPPGEYTETGDSAWAEPRTVPRGRVSTSSVHTAAAAPTGLHAEVVEANGIRFEWADHASDEEGYLLEVRPAGGRQYGAVAVLDPDVNSFGLVTLPTEKRASYRVRAFYFGAPSNVAHQTTGAGPP
jgi:hypothetical protein